EEKKAFGPLAYLPAVLRGLSGAEAVALTIRTEREEHRGRFLQLVAASGRGHAGPFPVTEAASLIDGRLSVYAVGETAESSLTDYVAGLVTRTHWLLPHVWTAEAARVEIIAEKPMSWVVDGDRITAERLDLEIRAGALRVSSPPLCK
ncbi:MAG: hypothetical protein MH204_06470, partial [Fimbriimonadaceae bacterium]|nr:hypothetical protein [Fimbriimonadaceae bacterium]